MNGTGRRSFPVIDWVIVVGYAALIFFISSRPLFWKPSFYDTFQVDKMLHFVEYGLFGILLCRAIRRTAAASATRVMIAASIIAAVYAMSDEAHQRFVPTRNGNWYDVATDTGGAIVGTLIWRRSTASHGSAKKTSGEGCPAARGRDAVKTDVIDP